NRAPLVGQHQGTGDRGLGEVLIGEIDRNQYLLVHDIVLSLACFASFCHESRPSVRGRPPRRNGRGDAALLSDGEGGCCSRPLQTRPASASVRGVTKCSSRPPCACSLRQSLPAKSITTSPEVGRFSLSRSRASTSPEAINSRAASWKPGLCPIKS